MRKNHKLVELSKEVRDEIADAWKAYKEMIEHE